MSARQLTRRTFLKGLSGVGLAAAFAACTPQAPTAPPAAPAEEKEAVATAAPQKEASDLKGEVVVTSGGSQIAWEKIEALYEEQHPDVDVVIDLKRGDATEQYYRAQLASGDPRMTIFSGNIIQDLFGDNVCLNWLEYMDRVNPYTGKVWRESFQPNVFTGGSLYKPGEQYLLSFDLVKVLMFYNKTLADKLGLDADSPPMTWDEMVPWQQAAVEGGYFGNNMDLGCNVEWLMNNYGYVFYANEYYWDLCRCLEGDWCYDPEIDSEFMSGDWRNDPSFDDPSNVTYNAVRANASFRDGHWMVPEDEKYIPLVEELRKNINKEFCAPGWRGFAGCANPDLFYTQRCLIHCSGGWLLSQFDRSIQKLQAGEYFVAAEGEPTPTPDPQLQGVEGFDLGLFGLPKIEHEQVEVSFQPTIEEPIGFWSIPRKDQAQNELEVDFVMFVTSPEVAAVKWAAELDINNPDGSVTGPPAILGVEMPGKWKEIFAQLPPFEGNTQKPHPKSMIMMGGPQFRPDWDSLMGEYFDGEIDSETLRDRMRAFNMGNLEDNLKGGRLELSDLDHPERKPPER